MRKWSVIQLLAAACLWLMTSCATTTMNTVWKDKDYRGGKLEKVLVIRSGQESDDQKIF
jgi:hypothetical protein